MKLAIEKRTVANKGANNKLRREGHIPGILYGRNRAGIPIHVKTDEIQAVLRNMKSGLLATTVFELHDGKEKHKAIIKEIQYHVVGYQPIHIDFALLVDDEPVSVKVPIQVVGVADCVGVKLGGFVRQPIRSLLVSCLPKDIPQEFVVDVRQMEIGHSKTLGDIEIPSNVRPLGKMKEVALVITKKAGT